MEKKKDKKLRARSSLSGLLGHSIVQFIIGKDSLVSLQPGIQLGLKYGDSTRMKFPVEEFSESMLRLKKVKASSILSHCSTATNI